MCVYIYNYIYILYTLKVGKETSIQKMQAAKKVQSETIHHYILVQNGAMDHSEFF